jgi:hypothetical protein
MKLCERSADSIVHELSRKFELRRADKAVRAPSHNYL